MYNINLAIVEMLGEKRHLGKKWTPTKDDTHSREGGVLLVSGRPHCVIPRVFWCICPHPRPTLHLGGISSLCVLRFAPLNGFGAGCVFCAAAFAVSAAAFAATAATANGDAETQ